jgi:kumamolisin
MALPEARLIGPIDSQEPVSVSVLVRRRPSAPPLDAAATAGLSATSRQRLAREEFAATYGADPADLAKVEAFARAQGLDVVESDPARRTVVLTGPAGAVAQAFGVELARYEHPQEGTYRGREGPITLPADLATVVQGVFGLDNRRQAAPRLRRFDPAGMTGAAPRVAKSFTAPEVAALYDFPTGATGNGECIGVIELGGGFLAADLQTYFSGLGIPMPTVVAVGVDGAQNAPTGSAGGPDAEVDLDIEVAGGVAPGARIAVYFAPNSSQGFLDAITTAVHDTTNRPSVISISWGAAEGPPVWTTQSMQAFDQAFADAAVLGVTICCASGDNGSADRTGDGRAHVDFPASSPHALGCGGTQLEGSGTTITSEVVWNDGSGGATGGGISDVFGLPPWQQNAGVPPSVNAGGHIGRGVPDVCGDASPATGYLIDVDGQHNLSFGGTSAVAPLWAGLVALLNERLGRQVGYLNPVLYTRLASSLHDITMGNNTVPGAAGYQAGPGWDACTGLGSPDGGRLLDALLGELQLATTTWDGGLWHTIRHADGSWQQFGDVKGQTGDPGPVLDVDCSDVGGELQLAVVTADGGLRHTIRHADGSWQQFGDVKGQTGDPGR